FIRPYPVRVGDCLRIARISLLIRSLIGETSLTDISVRYIHLKGRRCIYTARTWAPQWRSLDPERVRRRGEHMRKGPNDREAHMSRRQVLISIGGAALLSLQSSCSSKE